MARSQIKRNNSRIYVSSMLDMLLVKTIDFKMMQIAVDYEQIA